MTSRFILVDQYHASDDSDADGEGDLVLNWLPAAKVGGSDDDDDATVSCNPCTHPYFTQQSLPSAVARTPQDGGILCIQGR